MGGGCVRALHPVRTPAPLKEHLSETAVSWRCLRPRGQGRSRPAGTGNLRKLLGRRRPWVSPSRVWLASGFPASIRVEGTLPVLSSLVLSSNETPVLQLSCSVNRSN